MKHLIADLSDCDKNKLWDKKIIEKLLRELSRKLNMNILTKPKIVEDKKGALEEQGITGFVILDESHLAIHTYPEKRCAYVDIFSCKEIPKKIAKEFIVKTLAPSKMRIKAFNR